MKNTLKHAMILFLTLASTAHASLNTQSEGSGLMVWAFMGFVGLIIAFQMVPGLMLFAGMVKGLFPEKAEMHSELTAKE